MRFVEIQTHGFTAQSFGYASNASLPDYNSLFILTVFYKDRIIIMCLPHNSKNRIVKMNKLNVIFDINNSSQIQYNYLTLYSHNLYK